LRSPIAAGCAGVENTEEVDSEGAAGVPSEEGDAGVEDNGGDPGGGGGVEDAEEGADWFAAEGGLTNAVENELDLLNRAEVDGMGLAMAMVGSSKLEIRGDKDDGKMRSRNKKTLALAFEFKEINSR
jgi:hypothetical protein